MKNKSSFYIKNLGCSRRSLDAEKIRMFMEINKQVFTNNPKSANYIFLITCGLEEAEKHLKKLIKDFKNIKGEIIIFGCLPKTNPKYLKKLFRGRWLSTLNIDKIDKFFPDFKTKFNEMPDSNKMLKYEYKNKFGYTSLKKIIKIKLNRKKIGKALISFSRKVKSIRNKLKIRKLFSFENFLKGLGEDFYDPNPDNNFYSIKISEGCLGNCSYCTIKKAIGKLKSKPLDKIIKEIKKINSKKEYWINIQSSDSGSYGLDINSNLKNLFEEILKQNPKICFSFIQDLHPKWLCKYKKTFFKLSKAKKIDSILTPFQSGSNKILKLMNRKQNINEYIEVLNKMKKLNPSLRIRTQIIVGFPKETEKDFKKTLEVLKKVKFDKIDIFPYYETEDMKSYKITPKVDKKTIKKRIEKIKKEFNII